MHRRSRRAPWRAIIAAGIVPACLEIMDRLSMEAAERRPAPACRLDAGAALITSATGTRLRCEEDIADIE